MSEHTPGPWTFHLPHSSDYWAPAFIKVSGSIVAEAFSRNGFQERDANARLIAASPQLLEACEAMLAQFEHWLPQLTSEERGVEIEPVRMARSAISKARGEG